MTNLRSIAGGMGWAFISLLLVVAALEPVPVSSDMPVPVYVALA